MAGKSYQYKVLCPVCALQKYNYEMQKRWDNQYVCKDCWEPRNISDFYKNKSDFHPLPFILPDNEGVNVLSSVSGARLTFAGEISRGTWAAATGITATSGLTFPVFYFLYNGAYTSVLKNGTEQLGDPNQQMVTVYLVPADTLAVVYTSAPSFVRYR